MIYYFNISKYGDCSKFNVFYNYCLFLSGDSTSYNSKQYILFVSVLRRRKSGGRGCTPAPSMTKCKKAIQLLFGLHYVDFPMLLTLC